MLMSSTLDLPPNMTPRAEGPAVAVDGERSSMSGDSGSSNAESNDSFDLPPGLAGHMGTTFGVRSGSRSLRVSTEPRITVVRVKR